MYFCRKTKREFDSKTGILNHLMKVYNNSEEAYLNENNVIPSKCIYCGNDAKFISFFQGYHYRCDSKECIERSKFEGINKSNFYRKEKWNQIRKEYLCYIKRNILFYYRNKENTYIVDPFFNENIKDFKLKQYIRRKLKNDVFVIVKCKICGNNIKRQFLDLERTVCRKSFCLRNKNKNIDFPILWNGKDVNNFYHMLVIQGESFENAFYEVSKRCRDKNLWKFIIKPGKYPYDYFKCPINKYIIPLTRNSSRIVKYLEFNQIDVEEYYSKFLPKYISYCKNCGTFIRLSKDLLKEVKEKFCCKDCYYKYKRNNPDQYEVLSKTRKKLSDNMKKMIENGLIVPERNIWNGENVELNGMRYRSTWEAVFHYLNPDLHYEDLIIKYFSESDQKERNYIIDFVDWKKKLLYEIKPSSFHKDTNFMDKKKSTEKWCNENGFSFLIIDESYFKNYVTEEVIQDLPVELKRKMEKLVNGQDKQNQQNRV